MNILVVEDDPVSALVMKRALISLGHTVVSARNGADALSLLMEQSFTIIISDWMMPQMDGLELCRRVRAAQENFYTYFVLISSKEAQEDRMEALQAGVDDFLVKSLDTAELFARLNVAQRILGMQDQILRHSKELVDRQMEMALLNIELSEQVTIDSLTCLKNHRAFYDELERCNALCARHQAPLSLILVDIDHFKMFNDTHGHPAGDYVLRTVANILRATARDHDFVARYGGEEFGIILRMTDPQQAVAISERLRRAIEDHSWNYNPITASFGVSGWSLNVLNASDLVQQADVALYEAKRAGRNRCMTFIKEMIKDTEAR